MQIPLVVQKLRSFYWYCPLVKLHRKGSAPAACAAALFCIWAISFENLFSGIYIINLFCHSWNWNCIWWFAHLWSPIAFFNILLYLSTVYLPYLTVIWAKFGSLSTRMKRKSINDRVSLWLYGICSSAVCWDGRPHCHSVAAGHPGRIAQYCALHSTVPYTVLHSTLLYCASSYYLFVWYIVTHCTIMYYAVVYYYVLYCSMFRCTVPYSNVYMF